MKPVRPRALGSFGLAVYNAIYWPYLFLSIVVLFVPALVIWLLTFWQSPRRLLHAYTSHWAAHYLTRAPYAGVTVEGRERVRDLGPALFVVNHQSMVDILAVYALREQFLWVSKIENFYAPFLGWNMWLNGYIALRRGHLPSIRRMLRACEAKLAQGARLCVFPEGTRSRDGNLRPFYRGAFWIAARNRVPIVPVILEGTGAVLSKGTFGIRPQPVSLRVLEPIHPDEAGGDSHRLRDLVFRRMQQALELSRANSAGTSQALRSGRDPGSGLAGRATSV